MITSNNNAEVTSLIQSLNNTFSLKYLGSLTYFFGIEVSQLVEGDLLLTQRKYVQNDLLVNAKMDQCKPTVT